MGNPLGSAPEPQAIVDPEFEELEDDETWLGHAADDRPYHDEYEEAVYRVEQTDGYCFPGPVYIPAGKQVLCEFEANIDAKIAKEFGFD